MLKLFCLLFLVGTGLGLLPLNAAAQSPSAAVPPPLETAPLVIDPFERQVSTDDIVKTVNDCLASISPEYHVDVATLQSRGWANPHRFDFQLPGSSSPVPATIYSDGRRNNLVVEHLPNVEVCNAMGRISGDAQFVEILHRLPKSAGTELFDNHDGHDDFKRYALTNAGDDARQSYQFTDRAVILIQHLLQSSRTVVNVKVIPLKK